MRSLGGSGSGRLRTGQTLLLIGESGVDESGKQRSGIVHAGLKFRMRLRGYEVAVTGKLDELHEPGAVYSPVVTGKNQSLLFEELHETG